MKEIVKKDVNHSRYKKHISRITLILCAVIFIFSCFMIAKQIIASAKSKQSYELIQKTYYDDLESINSLEGKTRNSEKVQQKNEVDPLFVKEMPMEEGKILPRFTTLLEQNSDTVGWIRIPDTEIDYPVVQSQNNEYYLHHTFDKRKNKSGAIFMDFRNHIEHLDQNTIIYGHHMKDGSMFTDLKKYRNEDFVSNHKIITFDTIYTEMKWEVFAVFVTDTNFNYIQPNFETNADFKHFIDTVKSKSIIPIENEISKDDYILTLSTCGYDFNDARIVVQAKLIDY